MNIAGLWRLGWVALVPGLVACAPEAGGGFDRTLTAGSVSFRVQCDNASSINRLTVTPAGLELDNRPAAVDADGLVTGAEVADLDGNGFPEVYVYVTSVGSGSYGTLVAYAVNRGKSMTPVYLPPLQDDPALTAGYMGHDEFAVAENRLVRRFPLYRPGDTNAAPTGKTRQIAYRLVAGEAGWVLRVDQVTEH